ncbi:MAG: hypothetical protein E4H43_01575 [Bacteroidia bacterium]|nr:MAG: hypothetical protein E4H43_01575 [Bacteroidia bacterium]
MKNLLSVISAIVILLLSACKTGKYQTQLIAGYNFKSPDAVLIMPDILHESSGITYIDSITLVCIQDEKGILFFYDLTKKGIISEKKFSGKGDYEGIARVEDTIYVLRSDGTLFEIADFKSDNLIVTSFETGIPSKDNEGLCYDPESRRLLIACKEKTGKGDLSKDNRYIFGFDLASKKLINEPAFAFDVDKLKDFAKTNNIALPLKNAKKGLAVEPDLKFRASGIAIHTLTNKLYLLSAEDYLLFIFDKSGTIEQMIKLNAIMFNQSEGITILENGDLLISNEGPGKGPANMIRYNYKPE